MDKIFEASFGRSAPTSKTTMIDPEGDIILVVSCDHGKARFRVNSNTLCVTSPVFRAMLGKDSRFNEAIALAATRSLNTDASSGGTRSSKPYELILSDDNPKALAVVLRIVHMQNYLVPKILDESQLYEIAVICDKYDMAQSLVLWTDRWFPLLVSDETIQPPSVFGGKWLFTAYVFRRKELFRALSLEILLTTTTDELGTLVMPGIYDLESTQYIPSSILDEIATRRQQCMESMIDCVHQIVDKYNDATSETLQCKNATQSEACDSLVLGFLLRTFKRKGVYPVAFSEVLQKSIREMKDLLYDIEFPTGTHRKPTWGSTSRSKTGAKRGYSSSYNDNCSYCGYNPTQFGVDHSSSCSPIADFSKNIQELFDNLMGLDLVNFIRENKDAVTGNVLSEGQNLWDNIEFDE